MRILQSAVIYTALAFGANAALADTAGLEALREGDMRKLMFHSEPMASSAESFTTADGETRSLADWRGKHVLVNFWATWCAPCRKEMPALDALAAEFGGDSFEVVTIATGRNPMPAINRFFEEEAIENLPILLDPSQALARDTAVLGLPITVILDPDGQEIARLRGDADWSSDSAKAIIAALVAGS
ncbi:MAG: TlpA family protein disulfide reductase [Rhodobacteraceae bacterium]|nr:TlpA family protein disulfide reductase [Paracoccaceae bacterium]